MPPPRTPLLPAGRAPIIRLDAIADSQRHPARKGPPQEGDNQEDRRADPAPVAGFVFLGWLRRFRALQRVIHEHPETHPFPPYATRCA